MLRLDLRSLVVIIAPAINSYIWNIQRKEIAEPVNAVCRPSLFTMSIESMNGHNTNMKQLAGCEILRNVTYSSTGFTPSASILIPQGDDI